MRDEIRNDTSQPNAAAIIIMILIGSLAIVKANITRGGPKASKEQLKNSARVIFGTYFYFALTLIVKLVKKLNIPLI